jgi:uncharacterized protein (TIGR02147 family)
MTHENPANIRIYDYLDYRAFLRDYYLDRKARKGLSYRSFSARAGLSSPNYLKLVIEGKRNLTESMSLRFAQAAGLDRDDSDYFVELVRFNQSKSPTERDAAYGRLTGFRSYRQARPLDLAQAEYYAHWYLPAIRELAASPFFREDPAWIAQALLPRVSPEEAAHAIRVLIELGLLVRDEKRALRQGEALVSTGAEAMGVHIGRYHRAMMERAAAAIELVPAADRDISSLTLCLGPGGVRRLKERLQRFRKELLELSTLEDQPGQVVQLNLQVFPLSQDVSRGARAGSTRAAKSKEGRS